MTAFARRQLSTTETLGEKLRRLRTEAGWTLDDVAVALGIQQRYIDALERSAYADLPGDVYTRKFLRRYAHYLHVSEERVLHMYEDEHQAIPTSPQQPRPQRTSQQLRSVNVPKVLQRGGIVLVLALLLGYLGFTVQHVVTPPKLLLTAPASDMTTTSLSITVEGQAEAESEVRINGQEVFTDSSGHFVERIDLQPGLNVIKVSARKERSDPHVVTRRVIVEEPNEDEATLSVKYLHAEETTD